MHGYSSGQKLSAAFCAVFAGEGTPFHGLRGGNALKAPEAVPGTDVMFNPEVILNIAK